MEELVIQTVSGKGVVFWFWLSFYLTFNHLLLATLETVGVKVSHFWLSLALAVVTLILYFFAIDELADIRQSLIKPNL